MVGFNSFYPKLERELSLPSSNHLLTLPSSYISITYVCMYVCTYVCMYVCIMYECMYVMYVCMYVCMYYV